MATEENEKSEHSLKKSLKSLSVMCNTLGKICGAGDQAGYFLANNQFSSLQSCQLLFGTLCPVVCSADCFLHVCYITVCMQVAVRLHSNSNLTSDLELEK